MKAFMVSAVSAAVGLVAMCVYGIASEESRDETRRLRAWNAECHDESSLLSTASGSPNGFTCPNRGHRMHVELMTPVSNQEAAALVTCACERDGGAP